MKHYSEKDSNSIRRIGYPAVWLLLAVFNLGFYATAAPATYDSLLQEALDLRNAGNFAGAEQTLRNARTLAADTNEIDYLLGLTLAFQERFTEALQVLDSALISYPDDIQLQIARARVYSYRGDYETALELTEKVLEDDPGNTEAIMLQARVSYYQKDYQLSRRSYTEVLGSNPGNMTALLGLYDVEYALGNSDEAEVLLDRAATADPLNLEVKNRLERSVSSQQSGNEINFGYAISNIDGAQLSDWYDRSLEYRFRTRAGSQFFVRSEHLHRFGSHDTLAEIGTIVNWGSDYPLEMAVAYGDDSDFSPEHRVRLATSVKVMDSNEGFGTSLLDLSYSQAKYQSGDVKTGRLGITHYFSGFNGWVNTSALWVRDENDLSSTGWTSGINWQTSSRLRVGYALTDAPETENNITTDTETHHLYASYQLTDRFTLRLDGSRNEKKTHTAEILLACHCSSGFELPFMRVSCPVSLPTLTILALLSWSFGSNQSALAQESAFPGLNGPLQATALPSDSVTPADPDTYHNPGRNNLVVFLRDPQSSWLGLAHGLKSVGVPFSVTTKLEEALTHKVMLIYPSLTGADTPSQMLQQLRQFVRSGNTLLAFSVIGGGMKALFGYDDYQERNDLRALSFGSNELTSQFVLDPAESTVNLADQDQHAGGVSYKALAHPAIASFDDGSGAIIYNTFGSGSDIGHAYAIGFDFSHFILRAYNGRLTGVVNDYVNAYHPKVDSLLRFIAAVYRQGEDDAIEILPTPHNKEFTVLITHDIDYTRSLTNAVAYAQLESQLGVPATYFIQTKYITDYNDLAFFTQDSRSVIQQLEQAGMAIGSHSVAHSNEFRNMPLGSGRETYPEYRPFVKDFETVQNASVSGELRVSKHLLESLGAGPVVSFRPGHLSLPRKLPEMLAAHGYQYSSSITANEALTHYPYRTTFASEYSTETSVFEFPVTIEDEQGDLWGRLDQSIALANKISRHGGLVNLLIHTDETGQKLEFERRFIEEFKDRAWFSTVPEYGLWWRVRDSVAVEVRQITANLAELTIRVDGTLEGLSLRVPPSWQLADSAAGISQADNVLIIDRITDNIVISIKVH